MHQKVQKLVDVPVALAMRYGTMTIQKGLQELKDKGVTEDSFWPYIHNTPHGFYYHHLGIGRQNYNRSISLK